MAFQDRAYDLSTLRGRERANGARDTYPPSPSYYSQVAHFFVGQKGRGFASYWSPCGKSLRRHRGRGRGRGEGRGRGRIHRTRDFSSGLVVRRTVVT